MGIHDKQTCSPWQWWASHKQQQMEAKCHFLMDADKTAEWCTVGGKDVASVADFPRPLACASGGGAQRGAPDELLGWHHVQSPAVPWQIHLHLHLPPRFRQRRCPAQEGRELLQRQPGGGISLRRQKASAHGTFYFFRLTLWWMCMCRSFGSSV